MSTTNCSVDRRGTSLGFTVGFMLALAMLFGAPNSSAQATSSYNLQHNFWFTPGWWPIWAQGPGWAPRVWFNPKIQGQTWAWASASSQWGATDLQWAYRGAQMPPPWSISSSANAAAIGSWANANASVSLQPFGPWGTTWGSIRASGQATVTQSGSRADANSGASFWFRPVRGMLFQNAWWQWQPWFGSSVSGSASAWLRRFDPIDFSIFDPITGTLLEQGSLLDIGLDGNGDGSAQWQNGRLTMTPSTSGSDTMTLTVRVSDPTGQGYLRPEDTGHLRIQYTGDVITDVFADGQFASWDLPTVGHRGLLDMLAPDINFGVDFGRPVDAEFLVGTRVGTPVPESSTYGAIAGLLLIATAGWRHYRMRR